MPERQDPKRCWICDHALWLFPIWTWLVVCVTSVFMLAMLRPEAIGGWLVLMGSLLVAIGIAVGMLLHERRDRSLARAALEKIVPSKR